MTVDEAADVTAPAPLTPSRVERKRTRRIQEILTAAAELVGERGYDAVSLDNVADRLDVTKGSLYHYFPSKEELVSAAIETLGRDLTARLECRVDALVGTPGERLRGLLAEQLAMVVRDHPAAIRLFMLLREWPEPQHSRIKELRRRHNDLFRAIVEDGVRSGEFSVLDVGITLQCIHSAINQAPMWTRGLPRDELEKALATLVGTLMMLVGDVPAPHRR